AQQPGKAPAGLAPDLAAKGHEGIETAASEWRIIAGGQVAGLFQQRQIENAVADGDPYPWRPARGGEDAIGQVLDGEVQMPLGPLHPAGEGWVVGSVHCHGVLLAILLSPSPRG